MIPSFDCALASELVVSKRDKSRDDIRSDVMASAIIQVGRADSSNFGPNRHLHRPRLTVLSFTL